jgi:chemotaxis response regulator CheB
MPEHAIATGDVDHILPPEEMAPVILQYANTTLKNQNVTSRLKQEDNEA